MSTAAVTVAPSDKPAGRRLGALPALARGVQVLGELAGSGYRATPTLVRRGDGQLIKLTPLLYELIDAIDGRRGHEELARELGRRVGKRATAEDVRFLLEHKLRPLGILRQPDGLEPDVAKANPLLSLRPRAVISRPELTRKVTRPFVWLFAPTVMVCLLLAFGAISSWLLIDKGLSSALHQAFYEPWLILVIWALVVLSAAFHEIGHAAACRYGGATPGVIGGGLYMIWPAFYTDVSDAYRLGRRARLRVDLGGLYFSAIFAVATAALWRVTGADALLLVVAAQLLQIVRQLAPIIRADGYHILADLVGVPDLFAHIKPTLLGALPISRRRPDHRALKPWARAVVTGWVLITVPALAAVLGMIVLTFPRLAGTAWDSIGLRWAETTAYWSAGDVAGVTKSAISIALVALPVLSIVYLVSYLAQRVARRTWRATAGRPGPRVLALLGGAALVVLLAWAWWPGAHYRPIDAHEGGPLPTIVAPPTYSQQFLAPQPPVIVAPAPAASVLAPTPIARVVYLLSPRWLPYAVETVARRGLVPAGAAGGPLALPPGSAGLPGPPGPAESPDRAPGWPFPFDPPQAPEPGDNQAFAVNTTDGSALWDFALSFLLLETGDPVRQVNDAHAYASCTQCVTGAVAFQVLLIVGSVDTIIPVNAAVAANFECDECHTFAFAYQIIATLTGAPDAKVQRKLDLVLQRLQDLEANVGALTPSELYLALEGMKWDILRALEDLLSVQGTSEDSQQVGLDEGDEGHGPAAGAMTSGGDDGTSSRQADTERSAEEATAAVEPEAEGLPVEPEAATPGSESAAEVSVDGPGVDASAEQAGGTDETTASTACAEAGGTSAEECADETAPVDDADPEGSTVP